MAQTGMMFNDKKAPRCRNKLLNIYKQTDFFKDLKKQHPEFKGFTEKQIRNIIKDYNCAIWRTAINYRDGIELPEQLGYIFIGICPRPKDNPNYKLSEEKKVKIQHRNWESDSYLQKIFYTNFEAKYKFIFHELWTLIPCRNFKSEASKAFPKKWKQYHIVKPHLKIARLYRKAKSIDRIEDDIRNSIRSGYDEFNMNT